MSGKGSTPRPFSVDADTFASRWDAIFKKEGQGESQPVSEHGSDQEPSRATD